LQPSAFSDLALLRFRVTLNFPAASSTEETELDDEAMIEILWEFHAILTEEIETEVIPAGEPSRVRSEPGGSA
jgi:hypothetical protein